MWRLSSSLPLRAGLLLPALAVAALMGATAVSHAQITPYPVVLAMTGPATVVSGEELTYLVRYRLTEPETIPETSVFMDIPERTTYVSTEVVSGPSGNLGNVMATFVVWDGLGSPEETEGELALTVRIDDGFVGTIFGVCGVPGTQTSNAESRCSLETQVSAPGTQPEASGEAEAGGSGFPVVTTLLALTGAAVVGAALFFAVTAVRRQAAA